MRISLTPRAALVALLALPVIVLWPRWWVLLVLLALWGIVVLADAFAAADPRRVLCVARRRRRCGWAAR